MSIDEMYPFPNKWYQQTKWLCFIKKINDKELKNIFKGLLVVFALKNEPDWTWSSCQKSISKTQLSRPFTEHFKYDKEVQITAKA